jgi:hypothetical protein
LRINQFLLSIFFLTLLAILAGCARMKSHYDAHSSASPTPPTSPTPWPTPIEIKPADLGKLHWIEGSWRETGGNPVLFMRFKFENASTLVL